MTTATPRKQEWLQTVSLAVLLFLVVVLLSTTIPAVRDWQLRFNDSFFRLSPVPKPRSRVVLVLIDDESLNRFGRWPWSRTLLAKLTNNLNAAGASVIGLDILLSEPQTADADKSLQEALQSSRAVIVDKISAFADGPRWLEPIPQFAAAAAAVGHAQAPLDRDSVCRTYPARELSLDGSRWAFGVEVARRADPGRTTAFLAAYGIPSIDNAGSVTTAKPVLIPIAFRRDGFDIISAQTVLDGLNPELVQSRPVLVGFGTTEIGDRLNTPLHPEFPTPGVEVNAQIVDGILTGRTLRQIPPWGWAVVLLATCMASVLVFRKWRGAAAFVAVLVAGAGTYATALAFFIFGSRILPAGSMMLSVLVAPLLVYTSDFVRVERSVTQQLLGLRSWLALRGKDGPAREKSDLSWRLKLLQQLQTELGSLYELHKTLLESTQDLVAIFDEHGRLLLRNQAFAGAFQLEDDSRLTLEHVRSEWVVNDEAPLTQVDQVEEGEVTVDRELYSVRIAPLPPTKISPGGGTIVTLTSLRTRVERDRARSEALGFITHELRTPLSSIQGFAELMMQYPGSAVCAGAPETIFRESKRLLALISSYLDVLRLDAGSKPVSLSLIELESVVLQVFDILKPLAQAAGMQLVLEDEEPGAILGDAPLISGAVLNLVSNAIKYGQPGSPVNVRCFRDNEEVIISVHNLGKPIAEEEIARLFDAYFRASNVEKNKTGWGLGLAFVKRIAEKHGGTVRAESHSSGVVFEIHLPAKAEPVGVTKEKS
jgi:signal transduction histidine kinase/CHASE2 domain-containing sensor protein